VDVSITRDVPLKFALPGDIWSIESSLDVNVPRMGHSTSTEIRSNSSLMWPGRKASALQLWCRSWKIPL